MDRDLINKFHFNSNYILYGLPDEDLEYLKKNTRYMKYKKGQVVFVEGTYPSGIFFVSEGKVKKFKYIDDGREQIIYICGKGEFLGYSALLCDEPYPDSSTAMTDSVIGFIPKDSFLHILSVSHQLTFRLLKNLGHEFGVMTNHLVNFSHRTVRERVALILLILKEKFAEDIKPGEPVFLQLTREDLASIAGTAVETLVRLLRDFKDEKLIQTQGRKIWIIDEKKLIQVAHLK